MFTLLDPAAVDLAFTLIAAIGLVIAGAATIAALPWTTAEIAATERTFSALLPVGEPTHRRARVAR